MKNFISGLAVMCLFCSSVFAGQAQLVEQATVNTSPGCATSVVVQQPTPVVTQQQVIMVPQMQTVQVERQVTEYVAQTHTEVVEQQVCVMVPQVVETQCCVQQQVVQQQCAVTQSTNMCCSLGEQRSLGVRDTMTDKEKAMFFLSNAIDDMEIAGARSGKLRRAKRQLALLALRVKNERRRGGY